MEFETARKKVLDFRDARNWAQFHNPKDLAISISLEAAELLEHFQWSAEDTNVPNKHQSLTEELADVMIYCIYLADCLDVNITEIINSKLEKNESKYPVNKAKNTSRKYTELW
jgi:NTP pyrophosphatase (non-canonical NTP hydrolase)